MKKFSFIFLLSLVTLLTLEPISLKSQTISPEEPEPVTTRILFLFDASQSMYGRWQSDMKINIARDLLGNLLDSLQTVDNLELALRVYGHMYSFPPQVCTDSKLIVPFEEDNEREIKHRLKSLVPKGTTPIAYALEESGDDFPECDNCRNIIILITDGIEECDGDPCAVSYELQKKGIVLKPFIIGIGRNFKEAFDCVGTYFDASNEKDFRKALNVVISQALNSTTAQVNLLDIYEKPTETNVNMTFYDNFSGISQYNFIHTMNNKGVPDTLVIDPLLAYDIVVHTMPPVRKDSVTLTSGKHTVIALETPQGLLDLKVGNNLKMMKNLQCLIRQDGKCETLNVQNFGQVERYLVGKYDLEVLTLPRLYIDDVEIKQSHTTDVEIPMPGIAVIQKKSKGYGSLYLEEENELRLIYNLRDHISDQEVLYLQPGRYRVIFRSKFIDRSMYTVEKSFNVESGKSHKINLAN